MKDQKAHPLPHAREDVARARTIPDTPQTRSPTHRLAFTDDEFLCRDELRPVRLQLELLKAQMALEARDIVSTVAMFGGARIRAPEELAGEQHLPERTVQPASGATELSHFYEEARRFARAITEKSVASGNRHHVIVTGGGPGVMEAGNRGAQEAGGISIGLNIVLPHEQAPNLYVTPDLSFNFHYFAIRKMHFLMRARAIVVFPGGFGTLDELFEALTLMQTRRMSRVPVLLFGEAFWRRIIDWDALVEAGTIAAEDLTLFEYVETAADAVDLIQAHDAG